MSEYQHYEFRAVDSPLSDEQMRQLRMLSTRATITRTSFENVYHWGSFRGDPRQLVEKYFDAHVYVSNFGTYVLILRLPLDTIPIDDLRQYACDETLDIWTTDTHVIIEWRVDDEHGDWQYDDDDGWIDRLLPIREELLRGDYRSLYIGWLRFALSFDGNGGTGQGEEDDDAPYDEEEDGESLDEYELEPPVPAGLRLLTPAQRALAEFLFIPDELIEAAAADSPGISQPAQSNESIAAWVERMPADEARAIIVRIIMEDGSRAQSELRGRYYRSSAANPDARAPAPASKRRTAASLAALAAELKREGRTREEEQRERERRERLTRTMDEAPKLWADVIAAVEKMTGAGYDQAVGLLQELRDAHDLAGRRAEFDEEFFQLRIRYASRNALLARLKSAGLVGPKA
jgi:hypothetical protein